MNAGVGCMVTMIKELDNPTVHYGYGYLFKVRLADETWCSVVIHHFEGGYWREMKKALIQELKDEGVQWDTIICCHDLCYSKLEFSPSKNEIAHAEGIGMLDRNEIAKNI